MLPGSLQVPAAIVLLVGGAMACFVGYRLFRFVLAVFGFILGALVATSVMSPGDTAWLVAAAVVGGLGGAAILLAAYFIGVAFVGAGLGALVAHLVWMPFGGDPHPFAVILLSIAGALVAMKVQRHVVIVSTAFGGAWAFMVGGLALAGERAALQAAAAGDVWVVYPLDAGAGRPWLFVAWFALGLAGTAIQLAWSGEWKTKGKRASAGRD